MKIQNTRLKNGLETLQINDPGSNAATVQIWFRAGSALESGAEKGIAHFLEHMFFKGTKKRPGAALAHEVESFGGEINAFTSFDYTCYYINCPKSYLKDSINILMDMVSNPLFTEEELYPERDVVHEEYRRSIDSPGQYAFSQIQKNFFSKGYSHCILGTEDTIKKFTREQLISFRNRFYHLGNALLIVAGDLSTIPKLDEIVEHNIPTQKEKSNFPNFKLKEKTDIDIHQKDVPMSQLNIIINGPRYESKEAPIEDLLINCLGHGETSRLYRELVQNSTLASKASSSSLYMTKGSAHFIRLSFPHHHLNKVLQSFSSILSEIKNSGFEQWEIQKIKNQYIASKIYDKETIESFALSLGHSFAQNGDIYCEDKFIDKLKKVSKNQINEAFSNIFERNFSLSLQIPQEESIEKSSALLNKFSDKLKKTFTRKEIKKAAYQSTPSQYDPQTQLVELKKGINLLYRQNIMTPTFTMHAYVQGGLSNETIENNGIYQLLSSLLSKGYDAISANDIAKTMDDCSATFNPFSGKNAYGLTLHGQTEHIFSTFPHFINSLIKPKFPTKHLGHEKEMVKREIESHEKEATKKCFSEFANLIFNNHPYAMNIVGTKQSIRKISRKSIAELHESNLKKRGILFTYCGDLNLSDIIELLKPTLKELPRRQGIKPGTKAIKSLLSKKIHLDFDREQTQILVGTPTPKLSITDNLFYKIVSTHLSGQSSELFVEVRDKQGLCYATQPFLFTALEGGYWGIYMASGHDKVKAAIKAIYKIIHSVRDNGLTRDEFERVKKMIEGQNLLNLQSNEDYAHVYSIPVLQGLGLDYFYENNLFINNLTYEVFQEKIKKLFSKKFTQVTVGREE